MRYLLALMRYLLAPLWNLFWPSRPEPQPPSPPWPPDPVPPPPPEPEPTPPSPPAPTHPEWALQLLELHNQAREGQDLQLDPHLLEAAQKHSEWMTENGMSHRGDRDTGRQPADRARLAGYESGWIGENIAYGQRDAEHVFTTWMNSRGHRNNILNEAYDDVGFGMAKNERGTIYWTTVFGRSGAGVPFGRTFYSSEEELCPPGIAEEA